jgi:hypothetical protein
VEKSANDRLLETLLSIPQRILTGRDANGSDTLVAAGARRISGSVNVDLRDVVAGRNSSFSLVEDSSWQGIEIRGLTNGNDDTAYLVLTTSRGEAKERRYHTIVLMKDKAGVWRVENWNRNQ